jgi:antitoxin CptB
MLDDRRKRLKFRAWRRGFREIDLILGGFVDKHVTELEDEDLTAFEALLDERDLEVYDWIVGRTPAPPAHESRLLDRLRAFRPDGPPETA